MIQSDINMSSAYLEIIIGPMFSGKTSKLLEIYKQCNFCNIPVSVINHSSDIRYHETMLSSHDKQMIPCIQSNLINDIWTLPRDENDILFSHDAYKQLRNSEVILINEAQFFNDLYDAVISMLKNGKKVYISGLDGDFQQNVFGDIFKLIPHCDKIIKLTSLCSICKNGNIGIFSMRISKETEQRVIGSDNYLPVCRACYNSNNKG